MSRINPFLSTSISCQEMRDYIWSYCPSFHRLFVYILDIKIWIAHHLPALPCYRRQTSIETRETMERRFELSTLQEILEVPYAITNMDIEVQLSLLSQERVRDLASRFFARMDREQIDYPRNIRGITITDFVRIYLNDPRWLATFRETIRETQ